MLLNRYNFIVWGNTPPEPADVSGLPVGSIGRVSSCVLLAPADVLRVYINIPTGLNLPNLNVALVADNAALTVVVPNFATLTQVDTPGLNAPQYYLNVVIPVGLGLREEYYRLRIGSAQVPYYSNRLWYNPGGFAGMSAIFSFRSVRDLAYIPYELPELAGFRQTLRLKCYAGNPQNDTTVESYDGVTTGRTRTVSVKQKRYHSFTVENADAFAEEGFSGMFAHKDLLINGRPFALKTGFQLANDSPGLANGTFEVWESGFALKTLC